MKRRILILAGTVLLAAGALWLSLGVGEKSPVGIAMEKQKTTETIAGFQSSLAAAVAPCFGANNSYLVDCLNVRALELELSGEDRAAETLHLRALKLQEKDFGANSLEVAKCLDGLSFVCVSLGEFDRAESFSQRALKIRVSRYGLRDPELANTYVTLAEIYCKRGDADKALLLLEKVAALGPAGLTLRETRFGASSYMATERLYSSVSTLLSRKKYAEAEQTIKRLVACHYEMFGDETDVRSDLKLLVELLQSTDANSEAQKLRVLMESGKKLTRLDLKPYMLARPNQDDLIYHPILKSVAGHGLEGGDLPNSVFHKLNGCVYPTGVMSFQLRRWFGRSESDAAERFCLRVSGLSKDQVEQLAGKPLFRGGQISCWGSSRPGEDTWLYRLGYTEKAIRLTFAHNQCIESKVCNEQEDDQFQKWRAEQIVRWAHGKTVQQLLTEYGLPSSYRHVSRHEVPPVDRPVLEAIGYYTGPSTSVSLTIKRGICTAGDISFMVH
ncbi:MAG: hypothetical protein QG574_1289 [Cyanobacteriota bacterium erpe_2018_sw_21hr_WHONDRS-SW48-000092_B_bin.40]|jgi:tetratricopeptide (TPR) repeat protein|nr:hypothetical protein [Cyanobacteriota bacterium erpe_2018_sw_21hr_WHONDRS-SW48-000092_B_bin.40]